jgi:hypothetical protein
MKDARRLVLVVLAVLLGVPLAASAAAERGPGAAMKNPGGKWSQAWKTDPLATGAFAVHAGDREVTGRIATVQGNRVVIASDLGGNETLTRSEHASISVDQRPDSWSALRSGQDVVASYAQAAGHKRLERVEAVDD